MSKRGKKRRWLFILLILFAFLLIAVALVWYFSPRQTVNDAIAHLAHHDSRDFTATITLSNSAATTNLIGEQAKIILTLDGGYLRQEGSPDTIAADFDLTTETESISIKVDGKTILKDDSVYVLVSKAPPIFPGLAALKGQWIAMVRGSYTNDTQLPPPRELFHTVERIDTTQLNGEKLKIYQAEATPEAILLFMDNVARVLGTRLTNEQIDQYRQGVAGVDKLPVNLAITPWNRELRQINTIFTMPGNNEIMFELRLEDLDPTRQFTAPENVTSFNSEPVDEALDAAELMPSLENTSSPDIDNTTDN